MEARTPAGNPRHELRCSDGVLIADRPACFSAAHSTFPSADWGLARVAVTGAGLSVVRNSKLLLGVPYVQNIVSVASGCSMGGTE